MSYPWHSLGNESLRPNQGFTDDLDTFLDDNADATSAIEEGFPHCRVIPLSRLTIDEDGINSGDVDSFDVSFYVRERGQSEDGPRVCGSTIFGAYNMLPLMGRRLIDPRFSQWAEWKVEEDQGGSVWWVDRAVGYMASLY